MTSVGVVAIGRNEGERLRRCLASVAGAGVRIVYVDSNSTDGSVDVAQSLGAEVVTLDTSQPFNAARARNAGLERLMAIAPEARCVQFVDGDCEVDPNWLARADDALESQADVAVVCGRRRERHPQASIYNRLMDLEWDTPIGEAEACGGDAMMRLDVIQGIGGYDETVAAGEEPELCHRLRSRGWRVLRIDADMTKHDAAMDCFRAWWRRQIRSGYGAMDVCRRFQLRAFQREVRSCRLWTLGWAASTLIAVATGGALGGWTGAGLGAALGLVVFAIQWLRQVHGFWRRGLGVRPALMAGLLTMIGKWAQLRGQAHYVMDRHSGRIARMIEYKPSPTHRPSDPDQSPAEAAVR